MDGRRDLVLRDAVAEDDALQEIQFAVSRAPLAPAELTAAERARFDAIRSSVRRSEWLVGRRAVRSLMERLGYDAADPVTFPHPRLSLAHSGGVAIAAGTSRRDVAGVGVDVERGGSMRAATARFFLTATERTAAGPADLVRLWTVKEALFKANPANSGTRLIDYCIDDPARRRGTARGPAGCPPLEYRTISTRYGYVSVAVMRGTDDAH